MRRFFVCLVALTAAACRPSGPPSASTPDGPVASPQSAPAASTSPPSPTSAAATTPPPAAPAPAVEAALTPLAPPALAAGPIVVKGYPHPIRNGMNDPAQWFGWSRDGALFGYCAEGGGADVPRVQCDLTRRDGSVDARSSYDAAGFHVAAKKAEIERFVREERFADIKLDREPQKVVPPALAGAWAFTDIELSVMRVAATESKSDPSGFSAPAVVRVGGVVSGEPAVYPITLASEGKLATVAVPHFAVMNGMAISPDGAEIGMVGHFFACEYCDSFSVKRMPLGALAARVYNDAGFARHKKKEWARAAELFAKAAFADPQAKLPPYNLACALARQGDARAAAALEVAISRGGGAVRDRAKKDADFDGVRTAPWFAALVK
ncbi:MAG: hypothetical protein KC657_00635 [Myxococcales bacterium]|nr:hypothetical protein [Myxococcales bacterium]